MSRRGVNIYPVRSIQEAAAHSQAVSNHLGYSAFAGPVADTANRSAAHSINGGTKEEHDKQQTAINTMGSLVERVMQHMVEQNKHLQEQLLQRDKQADAANKRKLVHPVGFDGDSFKPLTLDHEPLGRVRLVHNFEDGHQEPAAAPHADLVLEHEHEHEESMRTIALPPPSPHPVTAPVTTPIARRRPHALVQVPSKTTRRPAPIIRHKLLVVGSKLADTTKDVARLSEAPGRGVLNKLMHVCTTDGRGPYIGGAILSIMFLFLLVFLTVGAIMAPSPRRNVPPTPHDHFGYPPQLHGAVAGPHTGNDPYV